MGALLNVPMSNLLFAIELIRKYEGFNEKAYPDPETGEGPFTVGYGTQYYPDGSAVKEGHCCTKEKALTYLMHEVNCINDDLEDLELNLDDYMSAALVSFIHSIGWKPFLYSKIIESIEQENWKGVINEISLWVLDKNHQVIGNLLERRSEEAELFLKQIKNNLLTPNNILVSAFANYSSQPHENQAIKNLELQVNPYVLAEFANNFHKL